MENGFLPHLGLRSLFAGSLLITASYASLAQQEPASPQEGRPPVEVTNHSLLIAIPADDAIYIDRGKVELSDIPQRVSAALRDKPPEEQIVYIKTAATVRYGTLVAVINTIRPFTVEIGLVSDRKRGTEAASGRAARTIPVPQQRPMTPAGRRIVRAIKPANKLVVTVNTGAGRNQRVEVNSRSLPLAELGAPLEELLSQRTDKTVHITGKKQLLYRDIERVIDVVKGAGSTPVLLEAK